jgi:NAD(P)-dependent dehydrogenase (short-subunit alcohol dehydrogenase family)
MRRHYINLCRLDIFTCALSWASFLSCRERTPTTNPGYQPFDIPTGYQQNQQTMKRNNDINVSLTSGLVGNPGQANYSAGKMGVVGLTKTMAKEWGRFNINVNTVTYGFIETRLTATKEKQQPVQIGENEVQLGIPDQMRQMAMNFITLDRAGTPEEAAGPVLFLASPLSDYVTRRVLPAPGESYL